jgi:two-component system, NtrC family, nitrogen regulation sensor histidine kinase GlnL
VLLQQRSIADKIDRQLTHRNAARSVTAMAAMLAHEVKNPLSGIRGAAQLLEENATPPDRELTRLICDEADRICALVDRMEVFSDRRPLERGPVNIHEVLGRVRLVAQNGFARHVRFVEDYDPSLPPVHGNRDLLIQTFLNLVKNAAEAAPHRGGEIQLATAYQHGVRLAVAGSDERVHLPLVVSIIDNGDGVPEDLRAHLFDPFVTTKHHGTGLGLALVAKVVGDHGGVIEFDSQPRRTVFRICLPMAPRDAVAANDAVPERTA